jgi:sugar phosphate isomerase/epimerase
MRDLSKDKSLLSINTATVKQWSLEQVIEGCARLGIGGIAPWRDKLHECGVEKAAKLIRQHGLQVSGLCRGGFFTAATETERKAALEDNRRAVDEAVTLGAKCLVLVVGSLPPGSKDIAGARQQVKDGIAALLPYARKAGMKLAIEPLHPMTAADRACVNTLRQANDICDELGDGLGVAVDIYHVWWDPELEQQIRRAGKRVLAFHVCDWLVPTTDLMLDRGMMGDGIVDIPKIRGWIEATGFSGQVEVEIFSANNWWKKDGAEVLRTVIARHQSVV